MAVSKSLINTVFIIKIFNVFVKRVFILSIKLTAVVCDGGEGMCAFGVSEKSCGLQP